MRSGDIQQKSASEWYSLSANTRLRVQFDTGDSYNLTASTTNFPGVLWFYLKPGVSGALTDTIDATVDFTGKVFRQCPSCPGEIVNDTGSYPFAIMGFGWDFLVYLGGINSTASYEDVYRFADTKMKFKGHVGNDWDWIVEGGTVSFAGQSGTNETGFLNLGATTRRMGTLRNIYTNATTYVPAMEYSAVMSNIVVRIDGGSFVNNGYLKVKSVGNDCYVGTNTFEAVNGADVTLKGNVTLGVDNAANLERRTDLFSANGSGTEVTFSGADFTTTGNAIVQVADGAVFNASRKDGSTQVFNIGKKGTADRSAALIVTGAGSRLDLSSATELKFYGVGTMVTVKDGAEVVFPVDGLNLAHDSDSEVEVGLYGSGSKLLFAGAASKTPAMPGIGSCTINVHDGFFGRSDGVGDSYRFASGEGSQCTLNIYGGKCLFPGPSTDAQLQVGGYGSATINLTGGDLVVSNSVALGALGNLPAATRNALLHQTGGRLYVHDSISVCYGSSPALTAELRLDGGETVCDMVGASGTKIIGKDGTGFISADGGTLKPRQTRTSSKYPYLANLDYVACGAKGLSIDTAGFDARSKQKVFTNKTDAAGSLVKAGVGTFYMQGIDAYCVSNTVLRGGTLCFSSENAADAVDTLELDTTFVFEGGALSIGGANSASNLVVRGIDVRGGGEIVADPTDIIVVKGGGSVLDGLKIRFTSAPAAGSSVEVLKFETPLTASQQAALRRVYCASDLAEGCHGRFTYDSATGKVAMEVVESAPISESGNTVWQGATGTWGSGSNWSAGLPDAVKRAVFADNGAERSIDAGGSAVAGAMRFTGTGYSISSSSPIELAGEAGAAEIAAADGTQNEISADMIFDNVVDASVGADGRLSLSGDISFGGLRKSGSGELLLGGDNSFDSALVAAGGTLGLVGYSAAGDQNVTVAADTLRLDANGLDLPGIDVKLDSTSTPAILDVRKDATVRRIDAAASGRGGFVKRGEGKLTIDVSGEKSSMTLATMKGSGANSRPGSYESTFFPDDGSAPANMFGGMTVAEGEMVVKGTSGSPKVNVAGSLVVGVNVTNVNAAAQPTLTLDGVDVDNVTGSPGHLQIGYGCGRAGSVQADPRLNIYNSRLLCETIRLGTDSGSDGAACRPTFFCTNSSVCLSSQFFLTDTTNAGHTAVVRCKDSSLWTVSSAFVLNGIVDAVFDNCRIGKGNTSGIVDGEILQFGRYSYTALLPTGKVEFVNGTVATVSLPYYNNVPNPFRLVWDDAEWNYGNTADYEYSYLTTGEKFRFELRGKGLILRPAEGTTFTTRVPFVGEGGLQNLGAGTVKFADGTYGFSGVCRTAAGAVTDLSEAGALANASFCGGGTVSNATLSRVRVVLDADDDWSISEVPTFDGCGFAGRIDIDLGRTEENPMLISADALPTGILVARLTNASSTPRFRLVNTGLSRYSGTFTVTGSGEVRMDVVRSPGFIMTFR